ncbi:MAG: hypothetical protein BWY09_02221 [Candidatus Hydrogenedentes bacterium ADurb.Bin179]|nr:MAG: hypothetical protein BWY09_02221 [Candidatus Hydrogenedentes bacterium ADurb.Bin179]
MRRNLFALIHYHGNFRQGLIPPIGEVSLPMRENGIGRGMGDQPDRCALLNPVQVPDIGLDLSGSFSCGNQLQRAKGRAKHRPVPFIAHYFKVRQRRFGHNFSPRGLPMMKIDSGGRNRLQKNVGILGKPILASGRSKFRLLVCGAYGNGASGSPKEGLYFHGLMNRPLHGIFNG